MINTKKQAFTLVELIVVITILAILGTIAFISLGTYTADARDSVRKDAITKIVGQINTSNTTGQSLLSFVSGTGARLTGISLGGTGAVAGTNYEAGIPNYSALNIKQESFLDPSTNGDYKVAATTEIAGAFEVAGSLEEGGIKTAMVSGSYNPRGSGALTGTGWSGSTNFILANPTDINFLKVGDTVVDDAGTPATTTITEISSDGMTITVQTGFSEAVTTLALLAPESAGLIADSVIAANAVTDNSTDTFPY